MHLSLLCVLSIVTRLVLAGMNLIDFDGCSPGERDNIMEAQADAWAVLDATRGIRVDWNEAAALEYLGPPALNAGKQQNIQGIYDNLYDISNGDNRPQDNSVRVRCEEYNSEECETGTTAFTHQDDPHEGIPARITFCPKYFDQPHLITIVDELKNNWEKYNMYNYDSTMGQIFLHEMLHIDWVTKSGDHGDNEPVKDLWLYFREAGSNTEERVRLYGPAHAKILARHDSRRLGEFIAKSDENLGFYLLAKYIQKEFGGVYPHRPFVDTHPSRDPKNPRRRPRGEIFEVDDNGNVFWNTSNPDTVLQDPRQELDDDTDSVTITRFISDAELPESYNNAWRNWALEEQALALPSPTSQATPALPDPTPQEKPIEPPGFEKIGAPVCTNGANNGSPLSIVKGQCVKVWDGYNQGGEDSSAQYQPNSPYNCGNNCFSYPKGFGAIQAFGDGTYGTNCEYFSDLDCKSSIGKTGNVVSKKKDGIRVLDEASGQKGFSMQCYFHC